MLVKIAVVALATLLVVVANCDAHSLLQGCFHTGDSLIYTKRVTMSSQNGQVVKTSVSYPNAESVGGNFIITAFTALDQSTAGDGGYVRLVDGRIGSKKITLDFISLNSTTGVDYEVQIFGMPYA